MHQVTQMQAEPVAVVAARAVVLAAEPVEAPAAAPAAVTNRFFQADGCTPLKRRASGFRGLSLDTKRIGLNSALFVIRNAQISFDLMIPIL
jgi:hypothetical protein